MFQTSDKRQKKIIIWKMIEKMHLCALTELNFSITVMRDKLVIYKETPGETLYCNSLI